MNTKWFTNPFFIYIWSFLAAVTIYSLKWSVHYSELGAPILLFILATIVIAFPLSFIHEANGKNRYAPIAARPLSGVKLVLTVIYALYFLEFAATGGIPLVNVILIPGYSYKDFTGLPVLHVILGTFNIYYAVVLFHNYISFKSLGRLIAYLAAIVPVLLVVNRGALMCILFACLLIFLMKTQKIGLSIILKTVLGIAGVLYLFGVIGNTRSEVSKEDKEYILRLGGANDEFIESGIPFEYYWTYLYLASPLGNFRELINEKESKPEIANLPILVTNEMLPDFVSKRIAGFLGDEPEIKDHLVVSSLNAVPVYYKSYYHMGWAGVWLMFFFSIGIMLIYPYLLPGRSKYRVSAWCLLLSLVFLNIFGNMWYTLGTTLIWPFFFRLFERLRLRKPADTNNIPSNTVTKPQ